MVSVERLADYRRDGYAVLPDAVPIKDCLALRARAVEIAEEFDYTGEGKTFSTTEQSHSDEEYFLTSGGVVRCFLEEGVLDPSGRLRVDAVNAVNKIGHAMHDLDEVFAEFSYTPIVAEFLAGIGMSQPQMLQSMYIFKSPGTGSAVVGHIDHSFLWTEPPSVTAFWYAIDDSSVENGCLWVLAGGHRSQPIRQRFRREGREGRGGSATTMEIFDDAPYPIDEFIPVEAQRGTLVVFDGLLPHFSEHNHSDQPRHAYTTHVIDGEADYLEDNWLRRGSDLPLRPLYDEVKRRRRDPSTTK